MPRRKTKKLKFENPDAPVTHSDLEKVIELMLDSFVKHYGELRELLNENQTLGLKRIEIKLDKYLDFMTEIAADIKIIKRSTLFLAKNQLSYEELRDLATIARDVKEDEKKGRSELKN